MRRVHVNGLTTLMDYCTGPSFASGGFIADSAFDGSTVINGSQQQWLVRNSSLDGWTNGVWNQVFSGVVGAPAQCFPGVPNGCGPYTTLATSPVTREAPYLYVDDAGGYRVFVPAVQHDSVGHDVGQRADGRLVDPDRRLLHRQADGQRAGDQQRAVQWPEPDLHARRLPARQDDQGEARGHGRARVSASRRSCRPAATRP